MTLELLKILLVIGVIANLLTGSFYPLELLKAKIKLWGKPISDYYLSSCSKCASFWISIPFIFICHLDWTTAFLAILSAAICEKIMNLL